MTDITAKLVKDFENGQIARRQLLRVLGLTATGAVIAGVMPNLPGFASSLPQASVGGGKAFPVTNVNHLSLAVADYAKSRDFYVDLFSMRVRWDDGKRSEVQFGSMTAPNGIYIGALSKPGDKPGVGHIALGMTDFWAKRTALKAELDRLGSKGGIRPDGEGGWEVNMPSTGEYMIQPVANDESMFPGAASPCKGSAKSETCKAGFQEGLKNLSMIPKPSGKGFIGIALTPIVVHTPDVQKDMEFFRDLFGMKVISDKEGGPNPEALLGFGENTLLLRKTSQPGGKVYCNEYAFRIENFNKAKTEAELKRRGLNPEWDDAMGWVIHDPDGLRIGITGKA